MSNDLDRAVLEAEVVQLRAEVERLRARWSPEPEHGSPITNADWRFLTESLRDILFYQLYIDHQGRHRFTYVSPAIKLMHGLTPEEVYADAASLRRLVLQDDLAGLLAAEAESIRTHTPFSYEVRMRAPGGAVRWILIRSAPFSVGEGTIWQGVEIDVTERRFSEDALRLSEDRFRAIVDQSPFSTIVFAANGEAVHVNEAHCRLWGVSRETVLGRDYNLLHDQQVAAVGLLPEVQRAFAGEQLVTAPVEYDLSATFGVGHKKVVRGDFFPARNAKGEVEFVILVHQDVTVQEQHAREQRKLQEQLQQAMKMEAVGRLAGGIAHDFNNLLTVIHGSLDLAEMDLHEPSLLRQHLEETRKASASASSLVRQLLAFSRRQIIEPKVIELNSLVTNLEKMLRRLVGEDIMVELALTAKLSNVKVDPGQFEQVVVNLAVNARDAMPDGGRLVLETANIELDAEHAAQHPDAKPGPYVMLALSDTGQGMSAEVKAHLFEPFFTTKPQGRGTGLGLAMAFGTVRQAGGTIDVYSELGIGTTFKIYLPMVPEAVRSPAPSVVPASTTRSHEETILVVEDDPAVRKLAVSAIARLGYRTLQAANGDEALRVADSYRGSIDLLMTDVVMPGMNGRQLAKRLTEQRPGLVVLFSSGFTENVIAHHGIIDEGLHYIAKPYSVAGLEAKLHEVLAAQSGR